MRRSLRYLPLLAVPLLAWWALDALDRESADRFAAAEALLANEPILGAGPIELASCGADGCGDPRDNIYRLSRNECFFLPDGGAPIEPALATGILVGDEGETRLVLLDVLGASVTALGEHPAARTACPKAKRR
jgi:hypothetical protein